MLGLEISLCFLGANYDHKISVIIVPRLCEMLIDNYIIIPVYDCRSFQFVVGTISWLISAILLIYQASFSR